MENGTGLGGGVAARGQPEHPQHEKLSLETYGGDAHAVEGWWGLGGVGSMQSRVVVLPSWLQPVRKVVW